MKPQAFGDVSPVERNILSGSKLRLERNVAIDVICDGDRSRKCGPPDANTIHFKVLVDVGANTTDSQGFVIDHQAIADLLLAKWSHVDVFPSCEWLANQSLVDIHSLIVKHSNAEPLGLHVTVSAFNMAGVTAEWHKGGSCNV